MILYKSDISHVSRVSIEEMTSLISDSQLQYNRIRKSNSKFKCSLSTEFEVELVATILVGVLLLVSALIAVFVLYRFRKSQELQVDKHYISI